MHTGQHARRKHFAVLRALLWEQWRQTRIFLLLPLGVALAGTLGICPAGIPISWILYVTALLILPFSHCDRNNLQPRLSQRIYALPVKPLFLAALYLAYRLTAITLLSVALLALAQWNPAFQATAPKLLIPGILVPILCYLGAQALLWTLGTIHVGLAAGVFLVLLGVSPFALGKFRDAFQTTEAAETLLAGTFAALCVITAILGAVLDRTGFWQTLSNHLVLKMPGRRAKNAPFDTPEQAQRWFEWRRKGYMLPFLSLILLVPVIIGIAYVRLHSHAAVRWQQSFQFYLFYANASLILGALVVGLLSVAFDYRDHVSGLSTFVMARAVSTRSLAIQRLRAAARSVLTTYALLFAGMLLYVVLTGTAIDFLVTVPLSPGDVTLTVVLLSTALAGHFALIWTIVSFPGPALLTGIVLWLTAIGMMALELMPVRNEGMAAGLFFSFGAVLLVGLIGWAHLKARRAALRARKGMGRIALVSAGFAVSIPVLFYLVAEPPMAWTQQFVLWIAGSAFAALACVAPLFVAPVWVHWLRHR